MINAIIMEGIPPEEKTKPINVSDIPLSLAFIGNTGT